MRLRKKFVYICYICIAVNQCCKKCSCEKRKKEKENSFNFGNKQKKRFQISCSNCTLHWKTNFLWYKNLLQHSCALFDAMIAKLPPIPPLTSYLCFFSVHFFLPLDKSTVQSKDSYRNKTPSPRKKNLDYVRCK